MPKSGKLLIIRRSQRQPLFERCAPPHQGVENFVIALRTDARLGLHNSLLKRFQTEVLTWLCRCHQTLITVAYPTLLILLTERLRMIPGNIPKQQFRAAWIAELL